MSRFEKYIDEMCDGKKKKKKKMEESQTSVTKMNVGMNEAKNPKAEALYWITQIEKSNGYKEDDTSVWLGPMLNNIKKALNKI